MEKKLPPHRPDFDLRDEDIVDLSELGRGAYGVVFLSQLRGTKVAVKRLKALDNTQHPSGRDKAFNALKNEIAKLRCVSLRCGPILNISPAAA